MKLLLDTHAFIWFVNGDESLSKKARLAILKSANTKYVSIASIWEMAIKVSLGKLKLNYPFRKIFELIGDNGFTLLPIEFNHALTVGDLEFRHRDPFDRMIISQAMCDKMTIVTRDGSFEEYNVKTIW